MQLQLHAMQSIKNTARNHHAGQGMIMWRKLSNAARDDHIGV